MAQLGAAPMSLSVLLHQCFPAAEACSQALNIKHPLSNRDIPGSGLGRLRLVSKGLVSIISSLTRTYNLRLTGRGTMMMPQMCLLKDTQLLELRIHCKANSKTVMVASGNHIMQMQSFIGPMHRSIHQIHKLYVFAVPGVKGAVELIAPVCAEFLTELHLEGAVHWDLFYEFGKHCLRLIHLTVTEGLVFSHPEIVGDLLPALTHLKVVKVAVPFDRPPQPPPFPTPGFADAGPCCAMMISCINLTSVNIGEFPLDTDTWQLLPPNLLELEATLSEPLRPDAQLLLNLWNVILHTSSSRRQFDLGSTVRILQSGSKVSRLELIAPPGEQYFPDKATFLSTRCRPSFLPLVLFVNSLVSNGLLMIVGGFNLLLRCWDPEVDGGGAAGHPGEVDEEVSASKYLQLSHAPMMCKRLMLENPRNEQQADNSIPVVRTMFPHLVALGLLSNFALEDKDLLNLAGCVKLQHLSLAARSLVAYPSYSDKQLVIICYGVPSLEVLQVQLQLRLQPPYNMDEDLAVLQKQLRDWGRSITLKAYTDPRTA